MWWKPWGVCVSFCFCKGKCTFSLVLQSHGGASDLTTRSEVVWRFSTITLLQEHPGVLWEVSGAQCFAGRGVQVFQCWGVFKSVCVRQTEREEVCVNCTDCYFAAVPGERERKRKRIGGKQKNESGSSLFCSLCSGWFMSWTPQIRAPYTLEILSLPPSLPALAHIQSL